MRRSYGQIVPEAVAAVYVSSEATHYTRQVASTIVWKDKAGDWWVDRMTTTGPAGLQVEERMIDATSYKLAPDHVAELERLLSTPEAYSGEVVKSGQVGVGAAFHTMEITANGRSIVYQWSGLLEAVPGQIADIVIGRSR